MGNWGETTPFSSTQWNFPRAKATNEISQGYAPSKTDMLNLQDQSCV